MRANGYPLRLAALAISTTSAACSPSGHLEARASVVAPLTIPPSGSWDGIDGSWSSFTIGVGTPAQDVRVFTSWMAYQTLIVHPRGCPTGDTSCDNQRGGIYSNSSSSTFDYVGLFEINFEENLDLTGDAFFGYDNVTLGVTGKSAVNVGDTVIGAFATNDYWVGYLGINPKPTNWTTFATGAPSLISSMRNDSIIPSVAFGYTAGARYISDNALASLTLGGYDTSRFQPNDIEYTLSADNSRDTLVAVQSITTNRTSDSSQTQLLSQPIFALLDASVAEMWLPLEVCTAFEQAFNLTYDERSGLYLANPSLPESLINSTVSIQIGPFTNGSAIVLDFPYSAFNLTAQASYSNLTKTSLYFPLRRAANDTQYTLGRAFMQEAYLSVDYERAVFNVSQAIWEEGRSAQPIAIHPPSLASGSPDVIVSSTSGISRGAIIGIAVGVVVALVISTTALWLVRRQQQRTRTLKRKASRQSDQSSAIVTVVEEQKAYQKPELDSETVQVSPAGLRHMPSSAASDSLGSPISPQSAHPTFSSTQTVMSPADNRSLLNSTWAGEAGGVEIHELPGDLPDLSLADSKQITEKDMMRHRERQYNGFDPVEEQRERQEQGEKEEAKQARDEVNVAELKSRRPAIDAQDVRQATEEEGGNKRFSFIDGEQDRI